MMIQIISLDDCRDRRETLINNGFPKSNVENYFKAIDRRNHNVDNLLTDIELNKFIEFYQRKPKCGEIGCLESHIEVYKTFLESNANFCFILEDDNLILKPYNFQTALSMNHVSSILENRSKAFIINLGLPIEQIKLAKKQLVIFKKTINFPGKIYRVLSSNSGIWRANAYIINRKAAENMIKYKYKRSILADDWSLRRKLKLIEDIFLPNSPFFYQSNIFQTTIQIKNFVEESEILSNENKLSIKKRILYSIAFRLDKILNALKSKAFYKV